MRRSPPDSNEPENRLFFRIVAVSIAVSFAVLSLVGYLLWRVTRFIDPPPPDEDKP